MTYEEAVQRNLRNKVDAQLVQYMEQIVEYHQELDLMEDGELIDTAAEKMFLAEQEGEPIDTIEALRQAYEEEENATQRLAELKEIQKHMAEEKALRGIEPLARNDLLNLLLNPPTEQTSAEPTVDPVTARKRLTRFAEALKNEPCLHDVHYFEDGKLWRVLLRFKDGELSTDAQTILPQMKVNAHRTMLNQNKDLKVITFIVKG